MFKIKNNQNQAGSATAALLVVLAVVVIGGAGYLVYVKNHDTTTAHVATTPAADHLPAKLAGLKTLAEVKPKAKADADGQDIVSVDLQQDGGKPVYMFKLANGRILLYDAKTGGKLTDRKTTVGKDAQALPDQFVPTITMEQAMQTAQAQLPGKTVTKIQLQNEERVVVYSVRFSQGGRVDVNAKTGELVKVLKGSDSGSSHKSDQSGTSDHGNGGPKGHQPGSQTN